ncbi:hypothetical protein PV797_15305 [Clostridiaceae bacterium M8S5]|nr:hypothetical protein PV797_15305 [Clostridiaceae bacterium M8S5]
MMHTLCIITIMIISGVLGGVVNNYMQNSTDDNIESKKDKLFKSIIIGIAATFLVPLFLNMISSDLIDASQTDKNKLFVFLGFCTIASIASSSFINSMTSSFLKQVDEVKSQVNHINKYIDPIVNKVIEDEEIEDNDTKVIPSDKKVSIKPEDAMMDSEKILILTAIYESTFVFRSIEGISRETKLEILVVKAAVSDLLYKGYIESLKKGKYVRYYITTDGCEIIKFLNVDKQLI